MAGTKIVFLDYDGVLNTDRSLATLSEANRYESVDALNHGGWTQAERVHVPRCGDITGGRMVNQLCEQTGARVVVSSRWLLWLPPEIPLQWLLRHAGLDKGVLHEDWHVDYFETRPGCPFGLLKQEACQAWLKRHPEVERYILFDDEPKTLREFGKRIITCTEADGITFKGIHRAYALLGKG